MEPHILSIKFRFGAVLGHIDFSLVLESQAPSGVEIVFYYVPSHPVTHVSMTIFKETLSRLM